jgi:predicted ArsR family transcriptional regulator
VANWTFLTNHARVLLCIAHDPGVRLRDIAASLGITERSASGIATDLAEAGYVIKQKDAAATATRSRPTCRYPTRRERTVGEILALLAGTDAGSDRHTPHAHRASGGLASDRSSGQRTTVRPEGKADRPAAHA